jgi:hypothetical protein
MTRSSASTCQHHGNYAGDDDHGDVDVIMHIGGPFADHKKIAEMATARTGQAVPIVQPIRRACTALMEDGTGVQFERMAYEHPAAQAVHEAIYDQAFVQGGLGRGINRSVTTPLEIFVYDNVRSRHPFERPRPVPLLRRRLSKRRGSGEVAPAQSVRRGPHPHPDRR